MYTEDRNAYRNAFFVAWQKYQKRLPLQAYEKNIVDVILIHPEYQLLLEKLDQALEQYELAENPFFHMGLHIAIQEQIRSNRPCGIQPLFQTLQDKYPSAHDLEHAMMTVLANYMWETQGHDMDEAEYLRRLQGL